MAISYHNLGNEEEFSGNFENTRDCFKKSEQTILENFGNTHKLYAKFVKHYEDFQQVL